jgi:hypothetical protein
MPEIKIESPLKRPDCGWCNDEIYTLVCVFEKETFEKLIENDENLKTRAEFKSYFKKVFSGNIEKEWKDVYVTYTRKNIDSLQYLTKGKLSEWKAISVYREVCEPCRTKQMLRFESSSQKEEKPRKRKIA